LLNKDNPEESNAQEFATMADEESQMGVLLSQKNVNLKRARSSILIKLSGVDNSYLISAEETLKAATALAPTDAKLFYNLGLTQVRIGDSVGAIETLKRAVELKPNYRNARFALGILLVEDGQKVDGINELNYILEYIEPEDTLVKQQLEEYR